MPRRRVCVVTGTRAEFGLLRWLMRAIDDEPDLQLVTVATGSHLEERFGSTVTEIEESGFRIDRRVPMLVPGDSGAAIASSMARAIEGLHAALEDLDPDIMVLLGDRYEVLAAATAAMIARVPIAHIHGGESSEGLIDEAIRHAVTKLSHLHFTAHETYRDRVVQLGEAPDRVWVVGALGTESARRTEPMDDDELERLIGAPLGSPVLLITLQPLTLDSSQDGPTVEALLTALEDEEGTHLVFTLPNADHNSDVIRSAIERFAAHRPGTTVARSLGQRGYLTIMARADAVVGNSSSGLLEAPALGVPSIDIGPRQRGRLRAVSVIHCEADATEIGEALRRARDPGFRARVTTTPTPFGDGGASGRIVRILRDFPLDDLLQKRFHHVVPS